MMLSSRLALLVALSVLLPTAGVVRAAVIDTLPYVNTPDWTDIQWTDTVMALDSGGTSSTLATRPDAGVWFGWGATYGDRPLWSPGTNADGNHLALNASFSAAAADWSAYFYDRDYYAAFGFASTGCDGNAGSCYDVPGAAGVDVVFADAAGDLDTLFVPLDLGQPHLFEFLLKDGLVSYRIDGQVVYAGDALASTLGNALLVIGDGSGPTQTGKGAMTVYGIALDTAPEMDVLVSVPLPATLPLLAAGLLGFGLGRRAPRSAEPVIA